MYILQHIANERDQFMVTIKKKNLSKYVYYLNKIKSNLKDIEECKKLQEISNEKSDISNAFNIIVYQFELEILKFNNYILTKRIEKYIKR